MEALAAMGFIGGLLSFVFLIAVVMWMWVVAARLRSIRLSIENFHNALAQEINRRAAQQKP